VARLRLKVNHRRKRFSLRWTGVDEGGSGLSSYTLQVKKPHRRWRTVKRATKSRSHALRGRRAGRYAFRVRALDGAGNRSRWSLRRATLRR
jgi:predicted phage tail protein